ncbi:MAG: flagellar assembly peptidoglycan hydrolase FlgJ [Pseudomonadota bacterium]
MTTIYNVDNALDLKGLSDTKRLAHSGSAEGTRKAAHEFEAMFLNMMLKGMRESLPHDDPLESDASRMATGLFDAQLTKNIASGKSLGLADAIVKQIERSQSSSQPGDKNEALPGKEFLPLKKANGPAKPLRHDLPLNAVPHASEQSNVKTLKKNFVENYRGAAEAASRTSGIPAKFILGQAALESGWGRHEVKGKDGTPSFNLFGIKAGANWKGATVDAVTTEFVNGVPKKVVQKFRAYASYEESFGDYAKMIANNPRYANAMRAANDATSFAHEMGRSGYATDPRYGEKLAQIMTKSLRDIA